MVSEFLFSLWMQVERVAEEAIFGFQAASRGPTLSWSSAIKVTELPSLFCATISLECWDAEGNFFCSSTVHRYRTLLSVLLRPSRAPVFTLYYYHSSEILR